LATVEIVDQSLRDGQQSLWGMRMRAGHILPVAAEIDSVGYRIVDCTGSSIFEVLVRYCRENPWEGLDLVRAAMPNSLLRAGTRSNGVVGMGITPRAIVELWVRTLARHGIGSLWIFDCLFNLEQLAWVVGVARDAGLRVSPQVMFAHSPVHTDEYYEANVKAMAGWDGLDTIILGDEAGVLTTERARTWIPRMVEAAGGVPLEMHFHNTTGLGTVNHLVGVEAGVHIAHSAVSTLANGPSMPSTEATVDNLRRSGHTVELDDGRLPALAEHFGRCAAAEGYPTGTPAEYRLAVYQQQLPGGMMGTLLNQLRSYGMEDRLPEVLAEVEIVRAEMGYPVMATPFSQLVGIQALLNVVNGERYAIIPDENLIYLAGHYGPHPGPVDGDVLDRAFSSARGRELQDWEPPQPSLDEIRRRYGVHLSDEELLLRYLIPGEDVDAMYAAGPVRRDLMTAAASPNVRWVQDLMTSTTARAVTARHGDLTVSLSR
jgi:oxaloacetate decarboxylase (Na+ extruding) subunit alpha